MTLDLARRRRARPAVLTLTLLALTPTGCGEDAPDQCPPEIEAGLVDLNAHPDGDGWAFTGTTEGGADRAGSPCGGAGVSDVVHRFVAPAAGGYKFSTADSPARWNTVIHFRPRCDQPSARLNCNNDSAYPPFSEQTLALAADEPVYVFVDGVTPTDVGRYTLTVTPR